MSGRKRGLARTYPVELSPGLRVTVSD